MDFATQIREEFARLGKHVDDTVVEEFAQHASAAYELVIALGGIAAIASHSVALRRREIGIRMALGAQRRNAVALIVRRALGPVAIGAVAGLTIASLGSRVLLSQLYGVSPLDPLSLTAAAVFLVLAAAAAAWLPARRAARVDPITVLRSE
ncbi:MAG TPA: FtsX-like permease family protein [Vicinamibacterales bacterium]